MIRPELQALLDALDEETRERWRPYLEQVDADVRELGPSKVAGQLDEALKLLLAVAYTVRLCHSEEESEHVLEPVRHAAEAIEHARRELPEIAKSPSGRTKNARPPEREGSASLGPSVASGDSAVVVTCIRVDRAIS